MRIIDADKLHYKRVWLTDHRGYQSSAVVVFAKEIDKLAKDYESIKIDECSICDLHDTKDCVQHGSLGIIKPCIKNKSTKEEGK